MSRIPNKVARGISLPTSRWTVFLEVEVDRSTAVCYQWVYTWSPFSLPVFPCILLVNGKRGRDKNMKKIRRGGLQMLGSIQPTRREEGSSAELAWSHCAAAKGLGLIVPSTPKFVGALSDCSQRKAARLEIPVF